MQRLTKKNDTENCGNKSIEIQFWGIYPEAMICHNLLRSRLLNLLIRDNEIRHILRQKPSITIVLS